MRISRAAASSMEEETPCAWAVEEMGSQHMWLDVMDF